jgi:DNA-binding MarR family transcriptional regulator
MSAIRLTPTGVLQAEETFGSGIRYAILSFLYEASGHTREVEEVIDHLKTEPVKVQSVLRSMINDDLIEEV